MSYVFGTVFSKYIIQMKKLVFIFVLLFTVAISAQKPQRVGYIDMEYILENVPEYLEAQNTLNAKVAKWKTKLDTEARHIELLKTDLANEKAILTKDLIDEKEEEITLKQAELRRLEAIYFGPEGDLFSLRKQLVKPIQDQVYNAVQNISKRLSYDFVFDKSSELVMLYSNKKYDISELVLKTINRDRKVKDKKKKQEAKKSTPKGLTDNQKAVIAKREKAKIDKEARRKANLAKRQARLDAQKKKRDDLRKQKEAKRKALLDKKNKGNQKKEQ